MNNKHFEKRVAQRMQALCKDMIVMPRTHNMWGDHIVELHWRDARGFTLRHVLWSSSTSKLVCVDWSKDNGEWEPGPVDAAVLNRVVSDVLHERCVKLS